MDLIGKLMFLFGIAVFAIVGYNQCSNVDVVQHDSTVVVIDTVVFVDTVKVQGVVSIPTYETIVHVQIPNSIDTFSVIKEYFTTKYLEDSIETSDLMLIIKDSMKNNSVFHRELDYVLNQKTNIVTNTIEVYKPLPTKWQLSLGAAVDISEQVKPCFFLGLQRKQNYYNVGYVFGENSVRIGYARTIKY